MVVFRAIFLYHKGMKKAALFFAVALVPLDFVMLFLAGISAYFLRISEFIVQYRPVLFYFNLPFSRLVFLLLIIIPFWLLIFAVTGLYKIVRKDLLEEFFQIIASVSFALMSVIIYIFVRGEFFDSRFIVLAAGFFAIVYMFIGRMVLRALEKHMRTRYQFGMQRVLMVGDDETSNILVTQMENNPSLGYRIVKRITILNLMEIKKEIENSNIDTIVVGVTDYGKDVVVELAEFCRDNRLHFLFAPTLFQTLTTNIAMDVVAGIPLIEVQHTALNGWGRVLKRTIDIFGSVTGMVVFSPLFATIAVLVKLDSKGPVFVALPRISMGKVFMLYKFRSMIDNAHSLKGQLLNQNERKDGGPLFKMHNDPRITRIGKFLRKTRLDEFPQMYNALRGEISLVGPRPHEPEEVAQYEAHHKKILVIKSGITGMAQISGASDLPFEEEVKLDTYYIENWSLFLDFKIILRTVLTLFRDRSAC